MNISGLKGQAKTRLSYVFRVTVIIGLLTGLLVACDPPMQPAPGPQPGPDPQAPGQVTGLTVTAGNAQVTLNWTAVAGATSYRVYRGTTAGTRTALTSAGGTPADPTETSFINTTLTNGTAYFYSVSAINAGGEGAQSTEASATPMAAVTAPGQVTGLTATAGNAQVTLSWTAVTGATSYRVYRGTTAGTRTALTSAGGTPADPTTNSFINTGLTNGTAYFYTVSAINAGGEGAQSDETPARTPVLPQVTGLTATAGNAQVTLSWAAVTGATSYRVYRGTTAGTRTALTSAGGALADPTTNSLIDTGLTNDDTYYYSVSAIDADSMGAQSEETSATPVLPQVTGLRATLAGMQVTLSWTAVNGATSYRVYRGTTAGTRTALTSAGGTPADPTTNSFINTGLANGDTYYYSVSAIDADSEGAQSTEVSATPMAAATAPGQVTGLTATPGNREVTLRWTPVEGATSYRVQRGTTAGTRTAITSAGGTPADPTEISFTDSMSLINGDTYYYSVSAINDSGMGTQSTEVSETPMRTPDQVIGLRAAPGNARVTLSWTARTGAIAGATSYRVYRRIAGGTLAAITGDGLAADPTDNSFTDTTSENGTAYFYAVSAINAIGEGPQSRETLAVTPVAPPGQVTGLTATAGNARVELSWTEVTGATSYRVYRRIAGGTLAAITSDGGTPADPTDEMFTDTGRANGTEYFYTVSAINAGGEGDESAEDSATPVLPRPGQVTGLRATAGDAEVKLSWAAVDGATSYRVYRRITGETLAAITSAGGTPADLTTTTSFTDTGRANGTAYFYTVSAINAAGEGPQSTETPAATPVSDTDGDGVADSDDVDDDNNGLIEISTLAMLENVRFNLAGTTYDDEADDSTSENEGSIVGAPTDAQAMAAPDYMCTDAATNNLCGYELTANIDAWPTNNAVTRPVTITYADGSTATPAVHLVATYGTTGFVPIAGTFAGIFDGTGKTIHGLKVTSGGGLFATISGPVTNLHLRDVDIDGTGDIGALASQLASGGVVTAVSMSGTVTGGDAAITLDATGGLLGVNAGTVQNSYATGEVTGGSRGDDLEDAAGGLVGRNTGTVQNSYATGNVNGTTDTDETIGGLVGRNTGTVQNSYATGNVNGRTGGDDTVGGLIGSRSGTGTVENNYRSGTVTTDETPSAAGTSITLANLQALTTATGWTTTNWDFGTTSQLPAVKSGPAPGVLVVGQR